MKQLNTLLGETQISARDRTESDSVTPAPVAPGQSSADSRAGHDHVDAVNQMFAEFELAYHNQFHKAYAREGSIAMAKKYWLSCLQQYSPHLIVKATRKVVSTQEYLPTLSSLVQACENARDLFGLPDTRKAFMEACLAPEPKQNHTWSHPAVYLAARDSDWFVLAAEAESISYPLFEYHYNLYCKRVIGGENLQQPNPRALGDRASRELDNAENRSRLNALRDKLKL